MFARSSRIGHTNILHNFIPKNEWRLTKEIGIDGGTVCLVRFQVGESTAERFDIHGRFIRATAAMRLEGKDPRRDESEQNAFYRRGDPLL